MWRHSLANDVMFSMTSEVKNMGADTPVIVNFSPEMAKFRDEIVTLLQRQYKLRSTFAVVANLVGVRREDWNKRPIINKTMPHGWTEISYGRVIREVAHYVFY